jgi:hypothetical protein
VIKIVLNKKERDKPVVNEMKTIKENLPPLVLPMRDSPVDT